MRMWGSDWDSAIAEAMRGCAQSNSAFGISMLGCVLGFGSTRGSAGSVAAVMRASPHDPLTRTAPLDRDHPVSRTTIRDRRGDPAPGCSSAAGIFLAPGVDRGSWHGSDDRTKHATSFRARRPWILIIGRRPGCGRKMSRFDSRGFVSRPAADRVRCITNSEGYADTPQPV
jgi:hypothetical protein